MAEEATSLPDGGPTFRWFLESLVEGGRQLRRVAVHPLPYRIGRRPGLGLTLPSDGVSKDHAEIYLDGDGLRMRDLGSKNGTFLNRKKVEDSAIQEGDIIHFAQLEFRLGRQEIEEPTDEAVLEPPTLSIRNMALPTQFLEQTKELPELLREGRVATLFEPIVSFPSAAIAGYEVRGRGCHPRLPEGSQELFALAAGMSVEAELSRLFRRSAIEALAGKRNVGAIFLNTHAAELEEEDALVSSLAEAKETLPESTLVLEIHEGALDNPASIDGLRTQLARIGIGLAYDDFGAGQARLLELAEVPPNYLKFDVRFVHKIDQAPPSRRQLVASLVSVARDLKVYTVAMGIGSEAEADVCAKLGFTHAQGLFYGKPRTADEL
jgi:EAL domain-containing protein (putative c-di-GMP-specific phosphodiesterase class I)